MVYHAKYNLPTPQNIHATIHIKQAFFESMFFSQSVLRRKTKHLQDLRTTALKNSILPILD